MAVLQAQSKEAVYALMIQKITENGGSASQWYAGIASDWKDRLFVDHQVPKEGQCQYRVRKCFDREDASWVEISLHEFGCKGSHGGGSDDTIFVYLYQMQPGVTAE